MFSRRLELRPFPRDLIVWEFFNQVLERQFD
jgi:hypothetical protein